LGDEAQSGMSGSALTRSALFLAVLLAAVSVICLTIVSGAFGAGYLLLFFVLSAPGIPLGVRLFGRTHAAGWIAGVLLGYATTTLAWWAVVRFGMPSPAVFVVSWAVALAGSLVIARPLPEPLVALHAWSRRDTAALMLLLLLVPLLVTRPFAKVGSLDAGGNHQYRAYFIADFVWHTALTAELAKQEAAPTNPYLAPEPLHYYWTYFRIPGTLAAETGAGIEPILKANAFVTALLFLAAIYMAAWITFPAWPFAAAAATALVALVPSVEGLASIAELVRTGQPLSELRNLNVDAVAAWAFKGLRIDNLPRSMWYTPQHSFSCALGLVGVWLATAAGVRARAAAILLAGCALGASVAFNPLLGAAFCLVYGVTVVADLVRQRLPFAAVLRHALAVLPVGAALGWAAFNQVGDGAGSALHFGFWGPARNATLLTFFLQFGPVLPAIVIGAFAAGLPSRGSLAASISGVVIAVLLMHLVTLTVDQAWVGFRGGQIFFVSAPALVARALVVLWDRGRRRAAAALVAFMIVTGLPTTVIDAFNAQDVANQGFAPRNEFHWTVRITPDEWAALTWVRENTPVDAIVQADPMARGRETWSLIPTFARRRMAAGVPVPLLATPEYERRNEVVRRVYADPDPRAAWQAARALGIDYLYVDRIERSAYPNAAKFDAVPELFQPVFRNGEASVYALRP
jgi:hypothetical protein